MRALISLLLLWPSAASAQAGGPEWHVVHPLPVADALRAVHVLPDGTVWIAGDHGVLLRVDRGPDGPVLTRVPIPSTPTLASVFDDIERSLGARSPSPSSVELPGSQFMLSDFTAIAVTSQGDLWVGTETAALARWDGVHWSWVVDRDPDAGDVLLAVGPALWSWGGFGMTMGNSAPAPRIQTGGAPASNGPPAQTSSRIRVLARQGDEVWAAGSDGVLLSSRAGAPFAPRPRLGPDTHDFGALWLDDAGTAGWIAARDRVYVKQGDGFVPGPAVQGVVADVFASPGGDPAWVVGEHAQRIVGGVAQIVPITGWTAPGGAMLRFDGERIEAVHGRSPDDVWMVGAAGLILHWDGRELTELRHRATERRIVGLAWEGAQGWIAASADGLLLRGSLSAGLISVEPAPIKAPDTLVRLPSGELVLQALCDEIVVQRPDGSWRPLPRPDGLDCIKRVGGQSTSELWAAGSNDGVDGKVWRLQGGRWVPVPTKTEEELRFVVARPDGSVWIGGDRVLLTAPRGRPLTAAATHEFDRYKGATVAGDALWIAGDNTEIGSAGLLLRERAGAWTRHDRLTANWLAGVAVTPVGQVWAVGLGGVAARSAEGGFAPTDTGTGATLGHLLAHPSGALLAVGDDGVILQRDPGPGPGSTADHGLPTSD